MAEDSNLSTNSSDLRNRIFFTIFILCIYRLGTYVPIAGIDPNSLSEIMSSSQKGLLGMFNVFSGGAVQRMAIFALGIMPYISSSIIVQLLTGVSDYFKNLKEQGEIGRKKNYTNYTLRYSFDCNITGLWCFSWVGKCGRSSFRSRSLF